MLASDVGKVGSGWVLFLHLPYNPYYWAFLACHHNIGWRHTNFRYVHHNRYNNVLRLWLHRIIILFLSFSTHPSRPFCSIFRDNWFDPSFDWFGAMHARISLFLLLLLRFAFFPCWRCLLAFATADIAAHRRRSAVHRAVVICMHHPVRPDRRHHQQTMCSICFSSITGISGK